MAGEHIFCLDWDGPYDLEELIHEAEEHPEALEKWRIYTIYSHHPLYGQEVLSYIGKAIDQNVVQRLKQHKWWDGIVYVASIYDFEKLGKDWALYENADYPDAISTKKDNVEYEKNSTIVSRIEELLIYSLAPAYNTRNKKKASESKDYRVFNTGNIAQLPYEVSGYFHLEASPNPEATDKKI